MAVAAFVICPCPSPRTVRDWGQSKDRQRMIGCKSAIARKFRDSCVNPKALIYLGVKLVLQKWLRYFPRESLIARLSTGDNCQKSPSLRIHNFLTHGQCALCCLTNRVKLQATGGHLDFPLIILRACQLQRIVRWRLVRAPLCRMA